MKKLSLTITICLLCILQVQTQTLWSSLADTRWYTANPEASSFSISTAAELAGLAQLVNGGNTFSDKIITLNADIDLVDASWVPIGNTYNRYFRGTLHGKNKKISNISIGQESTPITYEWTGLFGNLYNGAYIDSLHITSGIIQGHTASGHLASSYTGSIAGYLSCDGYKDSICVIACSNSAKVIGGNLSSTSSMTGGLIGWIKNYAIENYDENIAGSTKININDCTNNGTVMEGRSYSSYTGGLFGYVLSFAASEIPEITTGIINISNCKNEGTVIGEGTSRTCTGGLLGYGAASAFEYASSTLNVSGCENNGIITGSSATTSYTGGIFGFCAGAGEGEGNEYSYGEITIQNCYSHSVITAVVDAAKIGGIVGYASQAGFPFLQIENCYVSGTLIATGNASVSGGIVGQTAGTDITIQNTIAVLENIVGETAHRILGDSTNAIMLANNYASIDVMLNGNTTGSSDATSLNGADMAPENFYHQDTYGSMAGLSNWDFTNIWTIRNDNVNMPYFQWQSAPVQIMETTMDGVTLNVYNSQTDSIVVLRYATGEVLDVIYSPTQGESEYPLNWQSELRAQSIGVGDTLAFVSYEQAKVSSYPVLAKIESSSTTGTDKCSTLSQTANIYPNPTTGKVFIQTTNGNAPRLRVFTLQGSLLQQAQNNEIDLGGYDDGVYLLEVESEMMKVIKN